MVIGGALLDILALAQLPYLICFFGGFVAVLWKDVRPAEYPAMRLAERPMSRGEVYPLPLNR
jgi:hypothetical protein